MPRPVADGAAYLPGLDGVRAIAVLAVLAYHFGLSWAPGGLLGVGVFFTLSGFLITRILLTSWVRTGTLQLGRFWVHRARRLLPAVVLVIVAALAGTAFTRPDELDDRWGESISGLFYVANWHAIASERSYFERFAGPGPLDHLWSLAVEEQFYLVWPVLLLLGLAVLRLTRRTLVLVTLALAATSFVLLAVLATPGFDNTRAYEGTDTRAGGILVGAVLALLWNQWVAVVGRTRWRGVLAQLAGVAGLVVIGWLLATTDDYTMSLYHWGILVLSLATAAVLAAVALPGSWLDRALGVAPLRWVGERSYGIYLWHLPVVAAVPVATVADHRTRWSLVFVVTTFALAELSWRLVEDPIRRHGFVAAVGRVRRRIFRHRDGTYQVVRLPGMPAGATAMVVTGTLVLVACAATAPEQDVDIVPTAGVAPPPPPPPPSGAAPGGSPGRPHDDRPTPPAGGPVRTSCTSVVHVGESTSVGLVSPLYLPRPATRLQARLRAVGVQDVDTDIAGARSIVETWQGEPNAQAAVDQRLDAGYDGCWTIAMGTNDAANQAVGGVHPYAERIDLIMQRLGDQPVLWLTVKTLESSGPYADATMQAFDDVLLEACERYPNLRVYDWRAEVRDPWFVSDGIHFTSRGYAERARRIARALAQAFPADQAPAPGCVVGSGVD